MPISRFGLVEGQTVADIVLDTGCFRTMVHKNLVDKTKYLEGEAVTIRCIIQTAPWQQCCLHQCCWERMLLQENPSIRHTAAVYVVRTRGQTRQEEAEDAMKKKREPKWWRRQLKRNWLVVNSMTICLKRINPT